MTEQGVRALFGTLASNNDLAWPADRWPAMRFDRGLTVGATGGHGPIHYSVDCIDTDRIVFRFDPNSGLDGTHTLAWRDSGDGVEVIHIIDGAVSGSMVFLWPTIVESLHDALIEDAFDGLEAQLGGRALVRRPLPFGVRLRRRAARWVHAAVASPPSSGIQRWVATSTALALIVVAGIHLAWAFDVTTWPANGGWSLAETVVGTTAFCPFACLS